MASKRKGTGVSKAAAPSGGEAPKSTFRMTLGLDAEKIEAIQRCLKKGKLTITVTTAGAVKGGRARTAYIYD